MKLFLTFFAVFIAVCIFPMRSFAASLSFTESPLTNQTVDSELVFKISLTINTTDETSYYLRGVFYKSGTSNYCGFTWNGSSWYSGPYSSNEGWKNFQKVTIEDNKWEGEIKTKIDSSDSGCKESGEYKFKISRFTESGSSSFDTQDEKTFTFVIPTPSPTPSPSPSSAPTTISSSKTTKTSVPSPTEKKTTASSNSTSTVATPTVATKDLIINSTDSGEYEDILGTSDAAISQIPSVSTTENKPEVKDLSLIHI